MFTANPTILSSFFHTVSRPFFSPRSLALPLSRRVLAIRMASTLPRLPIFKAIASHDPNTTVVVHSASGRRFTYGELLGDVAAARDKLVNESGAKGLKGERIAFLVENSYDYVGARTSSGSELEDES